MSHAIQRSRNDLDFIIGLSFHKLEQVSHHGSSKRGGLLPFVLIRNALIAQPSPPQHPYDAIPHDGDDDMEEGPAASSMEYSRENEAIRIEQDLLKREQEHIWLEACFDELEDDPMLEHQLRHEDDDDEDEEDDDSLMLDDFGDMMFQSAARRAGIKPSYLSSSTGNNKHFHLTPTSPYFDKQQQQQQQQQQQGRLQY